MRVNFYATLRLIAGDKTVELPVSPGASVSQLLDAVLERFPPMRKELFDESGNLLVHIHVFVNGRDARYLESGLDTALSAVDRVDMFPAIAGG